MTSRGPTAKLIPFLTYFTFSMCVRVNVMTVMTIQRSNFYLKFTAHQRSRYGH